MKIEIEAQPPAKTWAHYDVAVADTCIKPHMSRTEASNSPKLLEGAAG